MEITWILTIAIFIDGLWLSKLILFKSKPKAKGATIIKGRGVKTGQVADLSDLGYTDPWKK